MTGGIAVFSGRASRRLGAAVARELGVPLGAAAIGTFPDGEVDVHIDESVRRRDVFVIQSTSPPVNDHLMELVAVADACRRASASHITAVIPYFGYSRSDKRHGRREPINARLVADLVAASGIDHVVTLDLHSEQIEGFFRIPVDAATAVPLLCDAVRPVLPEGTVVVSPDAGRLRMATDYAARLDTSVVLLHKTRQSGRDTRVTHLVGDVRDRACLIVDDMISTGSTIAEAVAGLRRAGARPEIFVAATHGVLIGSARETLGGLGLSELFVTDTVEHEASNSIDVHVVSVAPLLAATIRRLAGNRTRAAG